MSKLTESLKKESLNRIEREVKSALPHWRKIINNTIDWDENKLIDLIINDAEVRPEIESLIQIIIDGKLESKNEDEK